MVLNRPRSALRIFIKNLEQKGNSPTTINRHIWALKSFFRFRKFTKVAGAEESGFEDSTTETHYPRYLKDEEWEKLLTTATAPIFDPNLSDFARRRAKLDVALLMCYCGGGLRCREATHLQLTDVIDEGFLRVTRKGRHEDFVPVESEVIRCIKDYLTTKAVSDTYVFSGKSRIPRWPNGPPRASSRSCVLRQASMMFMSTVCGILPGTSCVRQGRRNGIFRISSAIRTYKPPRFIPI